MLDFLVKSLLSENPISVGLETCSTHSNPVKNQGFVAQSSSFLTF